MKKIIIILLLLSFLTTHSYNQEILDIEMDEYFVELYKDYIPSTLLIDKSSKLKIQLTLEIFPLGR